jgi:hypothetical protein
VLTVHSVANLCCGGQCIAVASPPHRGAGDLPTVTSLELHLPVVHPTLCKRAEEVEPQQWALGEAMMRTNVEVMTRRL